MPFDNERKGKPQNGVTIRAEDRCGVCGGELSHTYRALPQHDVEWPSGATSGGGKVERRPIRICENCEGGAEARPQIEVDPTIF